MLRSAGLALLGAVVGAVALSIWYATTSGLTIDFDRPLPTGLSRGFFPPERSPDGLTFAWTGDRAHVRFPGLDRTVPWIAQFRLRGARPDPSTLPEVGLVIDDRPAAAVRVTNDFQTYDVVLLPEAGRRGAELSLIASNTFHPGAGDPRSLSVVVDHILVKPDGARAAVPRPALAAVGSSAAVFGLGLGTLALPLFAGVLLVSGTALATAAAVAVGWGPYLTASASLVWPAIVVISAAVIGTRIAERLLHRPITVAGRVAVACSAGAALVKLAVLFHPDMPIGDALFHAHRCEWVLSGRYYFTSVAPGGYEFPYPIALYLTTFPFSALVHDTAGLVALLRSLVAAADAGAGLLLYPLIARAGDRWAGVAAVGFYHLIPLDFQVQAVANLTNAFGQSLFVAVMAVVGMSWLIPLSATRVVMAIALVSWTMLSHTSTFLILFAVLALLSVWLVWPRPLRASRLGWGLALITAASLLLSIAAYYAHFGETYRALFGRLGGEVTRPVAESDPAGRTLLGRLTSVPYYVGVYLGWPNVVLGVAGALSLWRQQPAALLRTVLGAWTLACAGFFVMGVVTPVDLRYYLAWFPALAALAGLGVTWAWRRGGAVRVVALGLTSWSGWVGVTEWFRPLQR
jgi:hypothetical protein